MRVYVMANFCPAKSGVGMLWQLLSKISESAKSMTQFETGYFDRLGSAEVSFKNLLADEIGADTGILRGQNEVSDRNCNRNII